MTRIYEALQIAAAGKTATRDPEEFSEPLFNLEPTESSRPQDEIGLPDITRQEWKPSSDSFVSMADRGAGVEQFRRLRSRIAGFRDEFPLKIILISSAMPEEGKTFVTANLAASLARNKNTNVLLIDGDLRHPTLHELLGAPCVPGLSEYLAGTADMSEIVQRDLAFAPRESRLTGGISGLTFIPGGKCADNNAELAASHRMEHLIQTLAPHFDWILIDASPVLVVPDAVELARAADAVLLVARAEVTRFEEAQRAQSAFAKSRILGVVLNAVRGNPGKAYYYDYYGTGHVGS